jgi:UDP-3-O-[3-hydroxymyristoyl] glucosamine N-acyltransferase
MIKAVRAIDICNLLAGRLEGNPNTLISKPAKIEEGEEGAISFYANPKYEKYIYDCTSSVLLLPEGFALKEPIKPTVIWVSDVYASLSVLMQHFGAIEEAARQPKAAKPNISMQAYVDTTAEIGDFSRIDAFAFVGKGAKIGKNVTLHAQVWIDEGVTIGSGTIIYSGVKIYKGSIIGENCILHAGAVIGTDGFGFAPQPDGSYSKIPQLGIAHLEDNVEVGANTTIDRAVMGRTHIGRGVKIDNLVQIAHNVTIGENTVIAAQAGIAGSTQIGKNCMIGGQAGFVGHIYIADGTKVQAQSGVDKSINSPNTAVFGSPAMPYNDFLRSFVLFKNLPALQKRLIVLERAAGVEKKKEAL